MPLILPARTLDTASYEISNSVRVGFGHELTRTFTASSAERKKHTMSCWAKIGNVGDENHFIYAAGADSTYIRINGDSKIRFRMYISSDDQAYFQTNRLFRDPSAWYHFMLVYDSAQSTSTDRVKVYVNGERQTSFDSSYSGGRFPDQNEESIIGNNVEHRITGQSSAGDFYLADWYYIGNQALSPSDFGETNDNGVWVPKEYTGSFGSTNDAFLQFKQTGTSANASGIGADTSGEGNHWAVTNLAATDVTTDTPTNNFATMNPVHKSVHGSAALPTFSEGNLKLAMNSDTSTSSTIAPSKGKWYVEYKQSENTADNQGYPIVAISACQGGNAGDVIGFKTPNGTDYRGALGNTTISNVFLSARQANDIFGFYIDLDNSTLIIHKNGSTYMNTGYTGGLDWSGGLTTNNPQTGVFHFYVQNNSGGTPRFTDEVNFGNPTFSISSSNADANGYGSFEYSPTLSGTNYYALCTKNLAEYG